MKTIKLLSLEMENFKGCVYRRLDLDGRSVTILGENGCGKTTHYDAVSWVLFGKDSHGNAPGERSDFQIKPIGSQGMGLMPAVTLRLEADGSPVTLKKVYRERWEKPRGSTEARFSGNTTEYYIDGLPKKESSYKAFVSGLIPEDRWRLLTDVYWFCRDMPWKDRRALLFELCTVKPESELLAEEPAFAPLLAELGRYTVEECRVRLKAERAKAGKRLEALPIRIDECAKSAAGFAGLDFPALRREYERKSAERDGIRESLTAILHNAALERATVERGAAANALSALENENTAHRQAQAVPWEDPRAALQTELRETGRRQKDREAEAGRERASLASAEVRLESYHKRLSEIRAESWPGSPVCEACGQPLPPERAALARAAFLAGRRTREQAVAQDAALLEADLAAKRERVQALEREADGLRAGREALEAQLEAMPVPATPEIADLPGYACRKEEALARLAAAEEALHRLRADRQAEEDGLREQAAALDAALDTLRTQLAKEPILADTRARLERYEAERRETEAEVSRLDALLFLTEEFTRYKSGRVTEAVNALFEKIRFRLFLPQVNGGLTECCDVLLDGRPYGTVSDGEKIKLGLDAINGLSRACGLCVPLFIDGAESVTGLPEMAAQTIRMAVREGEKELRYL